MDNPTGISTPLPWWADILVGAVFALLGVTGIAWVFSRKGIREYLTARKRRKDGE